MQRTGFEGYYLADRRLYLTEDDRVVLQGDPAARVLLVPQGGAVPRDRALALGLIDAEGARLEPWAPDGGPHVVAAAAKTEATAADVPPPEPPYKAEQRLYLTADGRVVLGTDPARTVLLVSKGCTIPAARARELGLLDDQGNRLEPWADPESRPVVGQGEDPLAVAASLGPGVPVVPTIVAGLPIAADGVTGEATRPDAQAAPPDESQAEADPAPAPAPQKQKSGAAKARARKAREQAE